MKTNKIIVAIILAGIMIAGSIYITNNKKEVEAPRDIMAEVFEDNFLEGCIGEDVGNIKLCNCMYQNLEKTYDTDTLFELSIRYEETGILSKELEDVALSCVESK